MLKIILLALVLLISGCAAMPIKDGGISIGKDTTATVDDFGVGRVDRKF
jgi:hypothetical protein